MLATGAGVTDERWRTEAEWAHGWLNEAALPLWWQIGADQRHGGYVDKIDQTGAAIPGPKRARVQARQIFVYAEAGQMGWPGPWQDATRHGVDFLLKAFRRPDGLYRMTVSVDGAPLDDDCDLYDQAFVLFGLAAAYRALGRPTNLLAEAEQLLETLVATLRHPLAGFEEADPRRLPLRSNPHMHLLEAMIAWVDAGGGSRFAAVGKEIVGLALSHLIDPATGAIGEYYDGDWCFLADRMGRLREPGHQFEWAYLVDLAGQRWGEDFRSIACRLETFGQQYGIDAHRGVAVFALDAGGAVVDADARLWAQTERFRTALVLGERADTPIEASRLNRHARESFATLKRFLDVPVGGLWHDRLLPDNQFVNEAAPASSFYHILTALLPLLRGHPPRALLSAGN